MEELKDKLVSLRDASEKVAWAERRRQQQKLISKTLSLVNKLEAVSNQLKSPNHTSGDLVKHMKLLTELRFLFRTDEIQSPVNCLKREMELITQLYNGLIQSYQSIIEKFSADGGLNLNTQPPFKG